MSGMKPVWCVWVRRNLESEWVLLEIHETNEGATAVAADKELCEYYFQTSVSCEYLHS